MKKKYFKFYHLDYLNNPYVQQMTPSQRGVYTHLLCLMASTKDGGVKKNKELIAILKLNELKDWKTDWEIVKQRCYEKDGKLYHKKMEETNFSKVVKVNNELTIEQRREEFKQQIRTFDGKYNHELLNAFFKYWAEYNKSKTKMRYEYQTTWELDKRLAYWNSRQSTKSKSGTNHKSAVEQFISGNNE